MQYSKNLIINEINRIRNEIGHEKAKIFIKDIILDEKTDTIWIITKDRGSKSAIIGKGGWVVGRLKEDLNIGKIHIESHSDFILKEYQMMLSLNKLNSFIEMNNNNLNMNKTLTGILNLKKLLESKIKHKYKFNIEDYLNKEILDNNEEEQAEKNHKHQAVVALSGGVDSSFSLILAKYLGFNPIAITIDPGTIILPKVFKNNIDNLANKLDVEYHYLKKNYDSVIDNSLNGRFHPCGRCSTMTGKNIFEFAHKKNINMIIFGDLLSTGCQCLTENKIRFNDSNKKYINEKKNNKISTDKEYEASMFRLNLPATLSIGKEEIREFTSKFNIKKIKGFGCPLLHEVHKKYPYIKKFSIQRILRETRSGALEPGEALEQIWSFYQT
ncbi:MAG: ATPase [Methanobrevibacter sp.]|jgi:predicted PP-loop superfamily ATPase|nr:ATPase [Candidatus Methanovirga basalitermitum]